MKSVRYLLLGLSAGAMMTAGALAADFGVLPADYQSAAQDYVVSRLADPRGAHFQFVGEPYRVVVEFRGHESFEAWAIDMRVRARVGSGAMGGYVPYTVVFVNGEPVAFEQDARRLTKIGPTQMAARDD